MKNLLGLIEVRNFIGAAVIADAVFKNTECSIEKNFAGVGSILLKITGEPESVKVAVELGANAARQLGFLLAFNIIEEPSSRLNRLFFNNKIESAEIKEAQKSMSRIKDIEKNKSELNGEPSIIPPSFGRKGKPSKEVSSSINNFSPTYSRKDIENRSKKKSNKEENTLPLFEVVSDTISRLRREALSQKEFDDYNPDNESSLKDKKVKTSDAKEQQHKNEIDKMNVHELRHLARSIENFPIKGRVISRANRNELISHFKIIGY